MHEGGAAGGLHVVRERRFLKLIGKRYVLGRAQL